MQRELLKPAVQSGDEGSGLQKTADSASTASATWEYNQVLWRALIFGQANVAF